MILFFILFICVTLDAFIYMMEKGATIRNLNQKFVLKHCFIFSSINAIVYLVSNRFSYIIFSIPAVLQFHQRSLLFLISVGVLLMIKTSYKKRFEEKLDLDFNSKTSAKKALITSIDTLLVGIYSSILPVNIYFQAFAAFIITFLMIHTALNIGYKHGAAYQKIIGYTAGGAYLFLAALQALQIIMY